MRRRYVLLIAAIAAAVVGAAGAVELPVVPVSVMANAASPPAVSVPGVPAPAASTPVPTLIPALEFPAPPLKVTNEKNDIAVIPGVTEIVPVALGQLNRIVTPFERPELKTTSQAATRVEGSVVYLAPKTETPVGLYLTEKGDESLAISITMVPKKIPPREIRLQLATDAGVLGRYSPEKARRWEQAYPYEETLRNLLRQIALGQLPPGYALRPSVPRARRSCAHGDARRSGILFDFERAQMLIGARLEVAVGVVHNTGNQPVELKESWCAGDEVAAVAFWPEVVLEPGQATEVYVAFQRLAPRPKLAERPSLLREAP
jgi:conjugal transfer pilus assembly protein TraK